MTARVLPLLCLLVFVAGARDAPAYWPSTGAGGGTAATSDMPTGATPTVAVTGRSVTVTWAQNTFAGATLGARGGGYTVRRYAEGSTTAVTPAAGCAGVRTGTADPLSCTETGVPFGRWVYRVTPSIDSFVGTEGPPSAVVDIALAAPVLDAATPANPSTPASNDTAGAAVNGAVTVSWQASTNATGYNVFRRLSGGTYDFTQPRNGATPVSGLSYADTTATGSQSYDYVVRAVASAPATVSPSSNEKSARVISRPPAPTSATATSVAGGVSVGWPAVTGATGAPVVGYDVYRRLSTGVFDYTAPVNGPTLISGTTYKDTTTAPGASYLYVVRAVILGAGGAQVEGLNSPTTAARSCTAAYLAAVNADTPSDYFRLGDTGTTAANTATAARSGTYATGATPGAAGAVGCDASTAATFNGSSGQITPNTTTAVASTNTFTVEVWFKTTARQGKLVGFGDQRTAAASGSYDRHLYIDSTGKLAFGVYAGAAKTLVSTAAVNDGAWHHAVGSLGAAGQQLYLDGTLVRTDTNVTTAQAFSGYWRIGYDNLTGWPLAPASSFVNGSLDEVAVYPSQLTATRVRAHYTATGR